MPLGRKTKIASRLNALNAMFLQGSTDDQDFIAELNGDSILKTLNQDMVTILGSIRSSAAKGGTANPNNIQAPPPFPCPLNRWMGKLTFDTTTKVTKTGEGGQAEITGYKNDHQSAMAINAETFRDRVDTLWKLREQENDLTDAHKDPNPGKWIGYDPQAGNPGH